MVIIIAFIVIKMLIKILMIMIAINANSDHNHIENSKYNDTDKSSYAHADGNDMNSTTAVTAISNKIVIGVIITKSHIMESRSGESCLRRDN